MRKYVFNGKILSTVFGAWSTIQATRKGPRDWRLILVWASWAISAAMAVTAVVQEAQEEKARELEDQNR